MLQQELKIALNTKTEIMWGIPGTPIMLNGSKSSITLDLTSLDQKQRLIIALGVKGGQITSNLTPTEIFPVVLATNPVTISPPTQKPIATPIKVTMPEEVAFNAKKILSSHLPEIRKEIAACKNMRLLKSLIQEEENGKARKMVLSLMRIKLSKFEEDVALTVNDTSKPADMSKLDKILPARLLDEKVTYVVEDLESETIEVPIPDKEVKE